MVPNLLLSVIVSVYNDERTVAALLQRVTTGPYRYPHLQVVVVDDGSRDQAPQFLQPWMIVSGVLLLRHPVNRGTGAAVRTSFAAASGDFTVIQDSGGREEPPSACPWCWADGG